MQTSGHGSTEDDALRSRIRELEMQIVEKNASLEQMSKELEIEEALDRVRDQTLAMRKSEEILIVCEVIYKELLSLGFSEMRNTLIQTFSEQSDFFWDYDYTGLRGGKITRILTRDFPVIENYLKEIKSSKDSFMEIIYSGKEFELFKEQRKATGQLEDPRMDSLNALYYYYYSIGTGAIGISTFGPIAKEKIQVLDRLRNVFRLSYQRYHDMEKAEAQGKEAQIEAALERIRSRTMAMQSSKELIEVVKHLYKEVEPFGVSTFGISVAIFREEENLIEYWFADNLDSNLPQSYRVKGQKNQVFEQNWEAWKNQTSQRNVYLEYEDKEDFDNYILEETEFRKLPEELKKDIRSHQTVCLTFTFFKYGYFESVDLTVPSEENSKILIRFVKVFEQTYTRFLDIQKAEAQARESQIQLALERVRARTMAMQNSDELAEAAQLLFQQVQSLGMPTWSAGYCIWDEDQKAITLSMSRPWGDIQPSFRVPLDEDDSFIHFLEAHNRGEELFIEEVSGEALAQNYKYLLTLPVVGDQLESILKEGHQLPTYQVNHCAYFSKGFLLFITYRQVPEFHDLFKRFTKVFEQTYTRFLDLQKAEEQAREAEIQLALERTRARTMAMQRSEDLKEVVKVLYEQLRALGFQRGVAAIIIMDAATGDLDWWMEGFADGYELPERYHVPYFPHQGHIQQLEHWKNGSPFAVIEIYGQEKKVYDQYYFYHTDFAKAPDNSKQLMMQQEAVLFSMAYMQYGALSWSPTPLSVEQSTILQRFAKVFEQSYTRFLDLQKAEAQAREAQIEAALERVRSRVISMRQSEELSEAAELLYREYLKFGVESFSCGYLINDGEKGEWKIWATNPGESFFKEYWTIPYDADHNLKARYESWKSGDEFHSAILEGEANRAHHLIISKYATWKSEMLDTLPSRLVFNSAHFSLGHLLVISPERFKPELEQLLVRFAKVFDLAYRRFLDLQAAEMHAREMEQQGSLDRIRAEIASMRTAKDLEQITPLIWRELQSLKVPFIRCGVFIMNEKEEIIYNYLSSPDGQAIAAFNLPYQTPGVINQILTNWRDGTPFIDFWDKQAMEEFADTLVTQGVFTDRQLYLKTLPSQGFYLHFIPFKQGMLYVGNLQELNSEEKHLLQSVASSFSTAYARYEDFSQLENAKRQIENTLTELKQTQTQLIQAEKMASLGELTAGIAHEIQNPLNFVNNFSEVSTELLEEMNEELENGNIPFVKEIASDLKQNLQKITHHGKRADSIVKGMLQHSRISSGKKEWTNLNTLCEEYLRLAYHGLRAKDKTFNVTLETELDPQLPEVFVVAQDLGRVILNLITNAFHACMEHSLMSRIRDEKTSGEPFLPKVTARTSIFGDQVKISISDNGPGIPDGIRDKIFQPFFTTKPAGQGTGLGLSLSYEIIKSHNGEIQVETTLGRGATFHVYLPVN